MFPNDAIREYASKNGWMIHKIEHLITAGRKTGGAFEKSGWSSIIRHLKNNLPTFA
jgi:hypothetical protein